MSATDNKIKLSVIVPVYNVEKYLEDCILSLLKQNYPYFEIIVVDDGSTDRSSQIVEKFGNIDNRIQAYHKQNEGLVSARKFGCSKAKGDYIIAVDSDDLVVEGYFDKIVEELEENGFPDAMAMGYRRVPNDGSFPGNIVLNKLKTKKYTASEIDFVKENFLFSKGIKDINFGLVEFAIWAKVVKTDIYIRNQMKVPDFIKYGEDLVFTSYLLNDITSFYVSNYSGYCYRLSETSMITHLSFESLEAYETTIKLLIEIYRNDINKVAVYSEGVLYNCLIALAKKTNNFFEFKKRFSLTFKFEKMWELALNAKYKKTIKGIIKHFALVHKISLFFYYLGKKD